VITIGKINYWTEKEIDLLKENFKKLSKNELMTLLPNRTWSSILTKANKIGVNKRILWDKNEDDLLKNTYEKMPMKEILLLFPNRTKDSIIHRAQILNLNSYDHPIWTNKQIEYIKDNWQIYPDEILALNINKTKNAVKRKRNLLGLHRQDKLQRTYENITKFIRGNIYDWKQNSMKKCNYQCVLTKSKEFEIHHLYPVNKMINNIYVQNKIEWKNFNDYSQLELDKILSLFITEQNKYPLGECVRPDIHKLFHRLYGQYNTTIEQWEQFKKDYKNGLYDNYKRNIVA
jgi:hypothetical protein